MTFLLSSQYRHRWGSMVSFVVLCLCFVFLLLSDVYGGEGTAPLAFTDMTCTADTQNKQEVTVYCNYLQIFYPEYYQRYGCPCNTYSASAFDVDFLHYCQCDAALELQEGRLCQDGCGITSLATIMTKLGKRTTPQEVRDGVGGCYQRYLGMTGSNCIPESGYLQWNGFAVSENLVEGSRIDMDKSREYLEKGHMIWCSSAGHIVAVAGIDENNQFIVHDTGFGCQQGVPYITTKDPSWCDAYAYAIGRAE